MMRLTEHQARELVRQAREYLDEVWVASDARFGWVVRAKTPFHDEPVILRTSDDVMCLIAEMFERDGQVREPEVFFVDADTPRA